MKNCKKPSIIDDVTQRLTAAGWVVDRWGNIQTPDGHRRIKFTPNVIRVETKLHINGRNEWVRIRSYPYKNAKTVIFTQLTVYHG